jgi:hypothetical protein
MAMVFSKNDLETNSSKPPKNSKNDEIIEQKKVKYRSQLISLRELFSSTWPDADLVSVLDEVDGDLEIAISRISEGYAQQWSTKTSHRSQKGQETISELFQQTSKYNKPKGNSIYTPEVDSGRSSRGGRRANRGGRGGRSFGGPSRSDINFEKKIRSNQENHEFSNLEDCDSVAATINTTDINSRWSSEDRKSGWSENGWNTSSSSQGWNTETKSVNNQGWSGEYKSMNNHGWNNESKSNTQGWGAESSKVESGASSGWIDAAPRLEKTVGLSDVKKTTEKRNEWTDVPSSSRVEESLNKTFSSSSPSQKSSWAQVAKPEVKPPAIDNLQAEKRQNQHISILKRENKSDNSPVSENPRFTPNLKNIPNSVKFGSISLEDEERRAPLTRPPNVTSPQAMNTLSGNIHLESTSTMGNSFQMSSYNQNVDYGYIYPNEPIRQETGPSYPPNVNPANMANMYAMYFPYYMSHQYHGNPYGAPHSVSFNNPTKNYSTYSAMHQGNKSIPSSASLSSNNSYGVNAAPGIYAAEESKLPTLLRTTQNQEQKVHEKMISSPNPNNLQGSPYYSQFMHNNPPHIQHNFPPNLYTQTPNGQQPHQQQQAPNPNKNQYWGGNH